MSEYDVLINKYNALNAGYDQLYPKPMKHANTHANGGTDPITPGDIGAYSKNEIDAFLANKAEESVVSSHVSNKSNPHVVTAEQVGAYAKDKTDSLLNNKLSTNLGSIGGDFANLDTIKSPGDYVWLDTKAEIGIAGALYTVRVAAPKYGSSKSVTQMMQRTYPASEWSIKVRSYYYASGWTPWRTLATDSDLATKVSKSGDTMKGILRFANAGGSPNAAEIIEWTNGLHIREKQDNNNYADIQLALYNLRFNGMNSGNSFSHTILHDGNAQSLGFPKIATGSYVGTGTAGGSQNATVLTFNFVPKFLILVKHEGTDTPGNTLLSKVGAYSISGYNGFYSFYTYSSGFNCTLNGWGTNTLSYYTSAADPTYQFNINGQTYFYMALG